MESTKPKDSNPESDATNVIINTIKPGGTDTPDSNKGLQDNDSVTDSPKITKPVLGRAQAKKRLMAFANKFTSSPVLKPKERDINLSKVQNTNVFATKKKTDNTRDLVNDVKDDRSRIENQSEFQASTSDDKKHKKLHKKKVEPKISAIEEIIREESEQRMLLLSVPEKISENLLRIDRNDRNRNVARFSQWGRRTQESYRRQSNFSKSRDFGKIRDRQFNDQRRQSSSNNNNGRRDRSRSTERRESSFSSDRKRSISVEMEQQIKSEKRFDKTSFKKGDKFRGDRGRNDGHRDGDNRRDRRTEFYYPSRCDSWGSFKSHGGRIRQRSLSSENYEDARTDVKFKSAEDYNIHLEQMLMLGSHRLERSCAIADGKNSDERKSYPPESIRVTKCKGSPILYCENPNVSLMFLKEQLFQLLPPDRCNLIRGITDVISQFRGEDYESKGNHRKWFNKLNDLKINNRKSRSRKRLTSDQQGKNISVSPMPPVLLPKSKWDSEDESAPLSAENILKISEENVDVNPEDLSSCSSVIDEHDNDDDKSDTAVIKKEDISEQEGRRVPSKIVISTIEDSSEMIKVKETIGEESIDEVSEVISKIDEKAEEAIEVGEKLISEYEQFMKIVSNNAEESQNSVEKQSTEISSATVPVKSDGQKEKKDQKNSGKSKKVLHNQNEDQVDDEKLQKVDEKLSIIENSEIDYGGGEGEEEQKADASDWENIREEINKIDNAAASSSLMLIGKGKRKRHRKKMKIRKEASSSESSDLSSSSHSESDIDKKKRRRRKRKKKSRDSSSVSTSSETESSSSANDTGKRKRRRSKKRKKDRKKSRSRKKRVKKEYTDSDSSVSEDEDKLHKKKRRKRESSKHRKLSQRRSKSAEAKKLQKLKKAEKNKMLEANSGAPLEKLKSKIVVDVKNLEENLTKEAKLMSQSSEVIEDNKIPADQVIVIKEEKIDEQEKVLDDDSNVEQSNSAKDIESIEPSDMDKVEKETVEEEENIVKEIADQSDTSSRAKKKKKKIRKKHRSSSTSSSSSISSSSTSQSIDSKSDSRSKKKKKKKRRSGNLSSKLMRKFKKYHSKLSSSLDFDALHFPSLTQLERRISKNITAMDDWEVDSQDDNGIEDFLMKSKEKLPKKQKKIEKEVRYDSKTDTYIAVEKKAPKEIKKKQTGPVCAIRIWEDEEEEGEREAILLMNKKKDTEVQFKPWEKSSEEVVIKQEIVDEEEPKPVEAPETITEELKNEERTAKETEMVPQDVVTSIEPTANEEPKKVSQWAEPVPDLKEEDLEDENLVPVNWEEEEEVEWATKSIGKENRTKSGTSGGRTSSESSTDSSDSSSSSESSDSDRGTSKKSRSNKTAQKSKDPLKGGSEESFAETEAMKKLRMSMFAEFAARESRDGFSDRPDSLGSSEIPLMVSRIPTLPIPLEKTKEDSQFAAAVSDEHQIDSTAEKEAIRRGYRDLTSRSQSPRSPGSRDSRRRYSPERNRDKSRIRTSEERRSVSSHRSGSRNSTRDFARDKGRIDDRDLRGHGLEGDRKYSPLTERNFREKRRSPVSWNRPRSRSRSWSRSRSRSPSKRSDRSLRNQQKRSNYPDDRRDIYSRSPVRGRSPLARDRGRWSLDRDRSRERDWSGERRDDRASYDHLDQGRDRYVSRRRDDEVAERDGWRDDDKIGREPLDMYVNRPAPDEIDDRIYRRNDSLDREILDGPIGTEFDKPRYRSRSRERRNRDVDWDRSRESPESDKFSSRRRQTFETKSRSRLSSPRSRSPARFNRARGRSRSQSWSKSRSRSRSVSRNRSRSRSSSRSRMIRAGVKPLDRLSRSRLSRSLSPQRRSPIRTDENRYRRSPSQECGKRIETIIHPSGAAVPLEDSLSIGESSEINLPPAPAQFEYNYYQGSNLTYPPRVDATNPSPGSPKRLSLDDRLELELGIKKSHETPPLPPPVPLPYGHPKYGQPMLPYPGGVMPPGASRGVPPPVGMAGIGTTATTLGLSTPLGQPPPPIPPPGYHCPLGVVPPVSHGSPAPPSFNRQLPTVVQVGNVLQVVPGDFNSTQPPPIIRHGVPPPLPPTAPGNNNSNRVVRVGNVLQVVPSTALDWSGRPPLPSGQPTMPMNAAHMGIRPAAPVAPYPVAPVIHPPVQPVPAVPAPVPPRPPVKSVTPLPIAALPKLEPPKAPPVIQPVYNYEVIMEARRKEREERKQIRAEKRLEKKRRKLERIKRRAKRAFVKTDAKAEDVISVKIEEPESQPSTSKDETEIDAADVVIEDLKNPTPEDPQQSEQVEETTPPEVDEDDDDEEGEGDVEEDDEDIEFGNEEDAEDDVSRAMNTISQQVEADIIKLAENPDAEPTTIEFKVAIPLPSPPKKGILVPPGFWEERFIHDQSDNEEEITVEALLNDDSNLTEGKVSTNGEAGDNKSEVASAAGENDKDKKIKTPRQRRARKSVQFADGIKPGEGTSPSGCEGDLPSPPPPVPITSNDPLHEQIRRSRIRKSRKKAKRAKPLKIKKKVKVKIIKLKKPKVTPLQAMMMDDSDEMDDRSPPPAPPGSPPPPHMWPSYLAAYSATLRPADSVSPGNGNQAPPPPTPLPLLVPPPPLNYTIQPFSK